MTGLDRRYVLAIGLAVGVGSPLPADARDDPPSGGATTELIHFESRGRQIRAVVFRPGANANGAGTVYMHGSGNIGPRQLRFAQRLAEAGYLSIVPTYLDAAADDNARRPEPTMSAWRACGVDAVDWLISQGIDRHRTAEIGYSLGSYIAVDGALGDGNAAAAIAIAGGWDIYVPRLPNRRIPVLIIRNELDRHVSTASTLRLRDFLIDASIPVRLEVTRGAPHIMNDQQWGDVYDNASRFLGENLLS